MKGVSTGIAGVAELAPGTHMCALYSGQQGRDDVMVPFLREGLRSGDRCLCLLNDEELGPYRALDGDSPEGASPPRLDVHHCSDVYLPQGPFSVDHMVTFLSAAVETAWERRFRAHTV